MKTKNFFKKELLIYSSLFTFSFLHLLPVLYAPDWLRYFFTHNWIKIDFFVFLTLLVVVFFSQYKKVVKILLPISCIIISLYVKPLILEQEKYLVYSLNKDREPENFVNPFLGMRKTTSYLGRINRSPENKIVISFFYNEDILLRERIVYEPKHNIKLGTEGGEFVLKIYDENWYAYSPAD
jgi:hypothetical protein